jgi:hypothetical protein
MTLREKRRQVHFPQKRLWCLRYIPNNRVCDIDGRKCYAVFASRELASREIGKSWMKEWCTDYRAALLPVFVPAAFMPGARSSRVGYYPGGERARIRKILGLDD